MVKHELVNIIIKVKKLEDIVGEERLKLLREKFSNHASKRVGELNPNFGKKLNDDIKNKIRNKTIEQF